jgi:uncharacterized Zn finger protein
MEKLRRGGKRIDGVQPAGRKIAESFWGQAWCAHLEKFSDYANRLPRGRSYVRNGSVCHLEIAEGKIDAVVSGSELYDVSVRIQKLPPKRWTELKGRCTRGIGSLLELLQGRISAGIMAVVTDRDAGLFPQPRETKMDCSCPDWADMCKHVAAVLYGVGTRLDAKPELLFLLRGVKAEELVVDGAIPEAAGRGGARKLAESDIAEVFGIDVEGAPVKRKASTRAKRKKRAVRPSPATAPRPARPTAAPAPPRRARPPRSGTADTPSKDRSRQRLAPSTGARAASAATRTPGAPA